jgi:signal transduction histidine kinase
MNLTRFRPTVRVRLTLLYGGLFLAAGAALLIVMYLLVRNIPVVIVSTPSATSTGSPVVSADGSPSVPGFIRNEAVSFALQQIAVHDLLIQGGIAMTIAMSAAVIVGWVVAGRVLHPVKTITVAARRLSGQTLHERIGIKGPNDELKELGDTFDSMLDRLDATFDAQRRFIANAAHELRTPLTVQRAMIDVALKSKTASAADLVSTLTKLRGITEVNEGIIDGLLTLAISERGLDHNDRVDLSVLAAEALQSASGHRLRVVTALQRAEVCGDAVLLLRMVQNLVDNAVRYNEPDGWLELTTRSEAKYVHLTVSNLGPKISTDDCNQLFEPFRRVRTSRTTSVPGTGLGLSIVRAISVSHRGYASATPLESGGLKVTVRLPKAGVECVARELRSDMSGGN